MSVLVVRIDPSEVESCSDWLFQLCATAIEERVDGDDPVLVAGFGSDDSALAARSVLQERWSCRLEDTGDEAEWRDVWLRHIEPIEIDGIVVHAPWHDHDDLLPDATRISIDPGHAFGSGHHATTQLAIEALQRRIEPGDRVLDVGCGTGILSIVAAHLGAASVTGVDLDHDILSVAEANLETNGVGDRVTLTEAPLLDLGRRFDVVVANIVVGDLRPLMPTIAAATERTAIVTGFLPGQLDSLLTDLAVTVSERRQRDGWELAVLSAIT